MTRLPGPLRPLFPVVKVGVVATTEVLSPMTRRLPGTADRPTPPRRTAASTPAYVAGHPDGGVTCVTAFDELQVTRPVPEGRPAAHPAFGGGATVRIPPVVAARVAGGRAVGPYGAVVTADDTLLYDLSPYYGTFRPSQHPIFLRPQLPPARSLDGSVAVLTTRGVDNYYHFVTDVLPRLEVMDRAGARADRYLVPRRTRFQQELLDRLGVTDDLVVADDATDHLQADELVVPGLPDAHLRTPPWVTAWLRRRLLPADAASPHRRLWVTRGQRPRTRRVVNEAAVLEALAPFGFETVDPGSLSVAEQIRRFAEAELVVGPHGAGLTNIAFCPPGAAVLELFPPAYVNPCYFALATTVPGLRYRYLVGDGRPTRRRGRAGVASDLTADVEQVRRSVAELLDG